VAEPGVHVSLAGVPAKQKARFIDPMLLLKMERLPEGSDLLYELKLDGYRAIAYKTAGKVYLRSRNDNDIAVRYLSIVTALKAMPDGTVLDGEVVAVDADGKPSFGLLQNYSSTKAPLLFYVFDGMILSGKDVMYEPLDARRALLESKVLPKFKEPIRSSAALDASLPDLIESVKPHGFEGLVGKLGSRIYEPGRRSGSWMKMRVNQG
jgi:ATP-dependent DNA ligase